MVCKKINPRVIKSKSKPESFVYQAFIQLLTECNNVNSLQKSSYAVVLVVFVSLVILVVLVVVITYLFVD